MPSGHEDWRDALRRDLVPGGYRTKRLLTSQELIVVCGRMAVKEWTWFEGGSGRWRLRRRFMDGVEGLRTNQRLAFSEMEE